MPMPSPSEVRKLDQIAQSLRDDLRSADDLNTALRDSLSGVSLTEGEADALLQALRQASADPAAAALAARLDALDPAFLTALIRMTAGHAPIPQSAAIQAHLKQASPAPVMSPAPQDAHAVALPSDRPGMPAFSDRAFDDWFSAQRPAALAQRTPVFGYGLYGEKRSVYIADQYRDASGPEPRSRHLGIDIFAPAGTAVCAPFDGRIHRAQYNAEPLDYGHTIILEHRTSEGLTFWTLYGHLGAPLDGITEGANVRAGQPLSPLGDWHENGGWAPHLHFQIITSLLAQTGGNFFGVGHDSLWPLWSAISPDPNLILRLPDSVFTL
nr:peptidoglycan DD-metalloendopeptidase family protein [uncultured Celeribacter sp.]